MTTINTATPKTTPMIEIKVMMDTNVLLGRRYLSANKSSKGSRVMILKHEAKPDLFSKASYV